MKYFKYVNMQHNVETVGKITEIVFVLSWDSPRLIYTQTISNTQKITLTMNGGSRTAIAADDKVEYVEIYWKK